MNILVIGNGFDLAHGLPTKYGDFLAFCKAINGIKEKGFLGNLDAINKELVYSYHDLNSEIRWGLSRKFGGNLSEKSEELLALINDNVCINYFLQCDMYQKENWIDFESEISRVIQSVDNDMKQKGFDENTIIRELPVPFLSESFLNDYKLLEQGRNASAYEEVKKIEIAEGKEWSVGKTSDYLHEYLENHPIDNLKKEITYKRLIARLENDLDKLIRTLEIYLAE